MTVAFKTFGCRLNQAESAEFEAAFEAAGFRRLPLAAAARVIVVHACAVTQKAENEGLRLLRQLRASHPSAFLVLSGCTVEALGPARAQRLGVDLVVPREQKADLVQLVLQRLGLPHVNVRPAARTGARQRAALKVQDGCDFRCAYCIVPHTRGAPRSRALEACIDEARQLIAGGFSELVVTGCNIACYADGSRSLLDLLARLVQLPGLGRLRVGSIEPGTVERDVVALMSQTAKVCRFLHLPVQSGDDHVLGRMGRRYTAGHVRETLDEALRLMPDIGLGADVICGFPGETEAAFQRTQALIADFPFSKLHVFPYSERPGTPAASFGGRVPVAERKRRAQQLLGLGDAQRDAFAQRFVGRPVDFIIERYDREGRACGWSGEYLPCACAGAPTNRRRELLTFTPERAEAGALLGRC
jgi:threonylcarbamoyladenosine tRNA methylthiotransferase MtaB